MDGFPRQTLLLSVPVFLPRFHDHPSLSPGLGAIYIHSYLTSLSTIDFPVDPSVLSKIREDDFTTAPELFGSHAGVLVLKIVPLIPLECSNLLFCFPLFLGRDPAFPQPKTVEPSSRSLVNCPHAI